MQCKLNKYYGNQIKEVEMCRAFSAHSRGQRFICNFVETSVRQKELRRWKDSIKMDFEEINFEVFS
jgi:hypothetical protein